MQSELKYRIWQLSVELNNYRNAYYNSDTPIVTDAEYDKLFDELASLEVQTGLRMANSPTQSVGYRVMEGLPKAGHKFPLLSIEKTKSVREICDFAGGRALLMMLKIDGLTLKLEYEDGRLQRASTRGDGNEGEDITHNACAISHIPMEIPYRQRLVVAGEAHIRKDDFEELKERLVDSTGNPYKNSRNMAAGAVRNYDSRECAKRRITYTPFSVLVGFDEDESCAASKMARLDQLRNIGFSKCPCVLLSDGSLDEVNGAIDDLTNIAVMAGTPIDGLVATFDDVAYSKTCGRTGHHYKDSLALKFEDDRYETVFLGIEWAPTRYGEISPVALFDTVVIDGCDVSRASLHNISFIRDLELRPGCRIQVSKRNMIIPHVEDNLNRGNGMDEGIIPSTCPSCGSPTIIRASGGDGKPIETLRCDNLLCGKQKTRKFVHFVSKKAMDIEGLSEATLERFIAQGWLNTYMDVYRLDEHAATICQMEGFGQKSWVRLWDAIQNSRDTTFERYVISMDIPMIGRSASKVLSRAFGGSLLDFENAVDTGFDFSALEDFGETKHKNIHNWFREEENRNLWEELQKMLNIKNENVTPAAGQDNPFAGKTIVVTGKLELFTRNSINAKIEEMGGKAGSAVSQNTDYLICGEKAGSKLEKAQSLGIQILSENEFLEMASA